MLYLNLISTYHIQYYNLIINLFHYRNQLEHRLKKMTPSNSDYKSIQRQLIDTMEKLSVFSSDSNSSF